MVYLLAVFTLTVAYSTTKESSFPNLSSSTAFLELNEPVKAVSLRASQQKIKLKKYTEEELDYFREIAFYSEFTGEKLTVRKWVGRYVTVGYHGSPSNSDISTLKEVIGEINSIVPSLQLILVDKEPKIEVYFIPKDKFTGVIPKYKKGNMGYFRIWWSDGRIYQAKILIASNLKNQAAKSHLIREELTQSLGLINDSHRYKDSIFFQEWTQTTNYANKDKKLIEMLYETNIKPGMGEEETIRLLRGIKKR